MVHGARLGGLLSLQCRAEECGLDSKKKLKHERDTIKKETKKQIVTDNLPADERTTSGMQQE